MATIKSISVSQDLEILRVQHHLSWSEAARVGMAVLLADREIIPYNNDLNLKRKFDKVLLELSKVSKEYYNLKEKMKKYKK